MNNLEDLKKIYNSEANKEFRKKFDSVYEFHRKLFNTSEIVHLKFFLYCLNRKSISPYYCGNY